MSDSAETLVEILKDAILINAAVATELVQLVENSSMQLHGDVPESCLTEHRRIKEMVIKIAEKWNKDCAIIRNHNLKHNE